jgi:hypothetical protein
LRLLLESARTAVWGLKLLWLDAGYEGRGKRWAEEILGLSVEVVRKPPEAHPGEGGEDMGGGVGKRRREDRLAEAHAAERLSGAASQMGS